MSRFVLALTEFDQMAIVFHGRSIPMKDSRHCNEVGDEDGCGRLVFVHQLCREKEDERNWTGEIFENWVISEGKMKPTFSMARCSIVTHPIAKGGFLWAKERVDEEQSRGRVGKNRTRERWPRKNRLS
jgi:hypothetical protein